MYTKSSNGDKKKTNDNVKWSIVYPNASKLNMMRV